MARKVAVGAGARKRRAKEFRGSCHCGRVKFRFRSDLVFPYQRCYCSICRKVNGGGGYAINLSGEASSLRVTGRRYQREYRAIIGKKNSDALRSFCGECGTMLWLFDPNWPELIHPFASAVDTALPKAPVSTHLMVGSKAAWVRVERGPRDKVFRSYPDESIAEWHARHGLVGKVRGN